MKKSLLPTSLAALLVALYTGCAHKPTVNTISNAEEIAQVQRVVDQRVYTDKTLGKILALTEIRESRTNDGFKRIQIFLKNYSKTPYTFSYRFNWYDEHGAEIETTDDEMWKKFYAVPGDDVTLTSMAPTRNCADFKVRIIARH